ncbi:proline-rich protein 18 [Pelecanus crispus]|uniref:proline-rich protein 18 n=1 Tax=Pelecanus crispus TaxID=36300 RepID=UPI003F5D3386
MGLQPRRAAGPCPPAGRCAALPAARTGPAWARSEEPEGAPGRTASLPPILPAAAASPVAARAQPKKPAAAPKKAAPRPAEETAARKARGAPPERAGPLSSSWPRSSPQRQPPRRPPAERGARPQPAPPQPRGRPGAAGASSRSCESLGGAAGEAALRLSLRLPPEAVRLLQRRSLERQRGQPAPPPGGRAAPARRGARAGGGGDLRALLKISLLNDRHRYDDEEYEEEEEAGAAVDEGLVRKCTEWLRGVESAAGRDRPDRLETLPHLGTL